jgi:hypothetical protein
MSSTDGDMEEIMEKDIDDTKKYIMSFPSKTKLVRIDDACLRRIDVEECLFPDDGWLDGDVSKHFQILKYVHCKSVFSFLTRHLLQTKGDGQLYVALSRFTARKNLKILGFLAIPDANNKKTNSDESKKEEASCQYLHEEHSLEGDPYILGEILCACTFSNHYAIF